MMGITKEQVFELLDKISFFKAFTAEEIKIIPDLKPGVISYVKGKHIVRQGDTDRAVYLLIKGKAKVTRKEKNSVILNTLKPGDVFGEIAYFSQKPRSTNIIALEDTIALKMDWSLLDNMDGTIKNKIKDTLIDILIQRIKDMNSVLIEYSRR